MRVLTCSLLLGALLSSDLAAQSSLDREEALREYQRAHPRARVEGARFRTHSGPGDEAETATWIYGTALAFGATPLESAANHVEELLPLLGPATGVLEPEVRADGTVVLDAGFERATGNYRFSTFRFAQTYGGVPVFRSGVGFLVRNEQDFPLVMATFDVKDLSSLAVNVVPTQTVTQDMLLATERLLDEALLQRGISVPARAPRIAVDDAKLVVWAGFGEQRPARPELAMQFSATRGSDRVNAGLFQRHLVLASVASGEVLYSENVVQDFTDVSGTVTGFATQGLNSLECDPEAQIPLPYIEASVQGGNSTFADASGQFVIPHGGTSAVTVVSPLRGQWFEVFDDTQGGATPQVSTSVTPPGPADLVHNPSGGASQFPTANVNAYVEANVVRDFALQYAPNFPTITNQTAFDLIVNEDNFSGITSCNAVYTGTSLVFWRNGGGCNNTSFTDVVHHEYGHHLINVTGNGQGQLGEGSGDTMGVLIQDEPILGQGFQTCGTGIRRADNNHQYPCTGAIHDCGQLISGCVWSLRNELVVTEPANYRDIGGSLFVNMLIVRGQMFPGNSTIAPNITIIYLELDDDDSDIGNGTPHYAEIAAGFGDHNMDAPPLQPITFQFPSGRPDMLQPAGGVIEFTVEVVGQSETPVSGTGVLHVDRGAGFESFSMAEASSNVYEAVFPALDCGSEVLYYVSAQASGGSTATSPGAAPGDSYSGLAAALVTTVFEDDFETNMGWSVSGDASDGQWSRGVPVGGGDRGDPPADGDGSGQCYLTDNVDGNSDVDGGSTILTSPLLDASGAGAGQEALISYRRWYSNTAGSDPMNDIFVVELSNNGGSTWVNLETVGPAGPEVGGGWYLKSFRIADALTPTNTMRVRFNASDLGGGSVVEAGVDQVRIVLADCGADCNVSSYCASTTNSSGSAASMDWSGSTRLAAGNFTLLASGAATNKAGLFFFGGARLQAPFGDGFRCAGAGHYGTVYRIFPLVTTDALGEVSQALNFGSGVASNIVTTAETNFQFWFRDPMGPGGNGFNLSDGLSVQFCP